MAGLVLALCLPAILAIVPSHTEASSEEESVFSVAARPAFPLLIDAPVSLALAAGEKLARTIAGLLGNAGADSTRSHGSQQLAAAGGQPSLLGQWWCTIAGFLGQHCGASTIIYARDPREADDATSDPNTSDTAATSTDTVAPASDAGPASSPGTAAPEGHGSPSDPQPPSVTHVHNTYPVIREIVRETIRSVGNGIGSGGGDGISQLLFDAQVDGLLRSLETMGSGITGDLAAEVATGLLTVTGNGSLTGSLVADGSVSANHFMATDASATSTFAGSLTIGTTTSQDRLTLDGAAYLASVAAPSDTASRLYNLGGNLYWAGNIVGGSTVGTWTTDATHAWRASGNVGIGTASPLTRLHVGGGTLNNSVDAQILVSRSVDDTISGNGHAFSDSSTITRSGTIGYNSFDGRVTFSGTNGFDHYAAFQSGATYSSAGTMNDLYGLVDITQVSNGTVTNRYGVDIWDVTGAGSVTNNYGIHVQSLTKGSNNFAVYTSGTTKSYFGGAIGIKTTTPEGNLDVGAGNSVVGRAADSGTSAYSAVYDEAGNGYIALQKRGSAEGGLMGSGAGNSELYSYASNLGLLTYSAGTHLALGTANTERMRITSAGNVGIGTTTPSHKLVIDSGSNGNSIASSFTAAGTGRPYWLYDFQLQGAQWTSGFDPTGGTNSFSIRDADAGVNVITIGDASPANSLVIQTTTGNVGIGTTSPESVLAVQTAGIAGTVLTLAATFSGAPVISRYRNSQATWDFGLLGDGTNDFKLKNYFGNSVPFVVENGAPDDALRIKYNTGNVGIGETAPGSMLSVSGGGSFGSGYDTTAAPTGGLIVQGNVGIGTTTPEGKLDIKADSGQVGINSFRVPNNSGAFTGGTVGTWLGFSRYNDATTFGAAIGVNNSQVFKVQGDSGLGIGIHSATGRVEIDSALSITGTGSLAAPSLALDLTVTDESGFYLPATNQIGVITDRLERVRIDSDGNVGIGETSPVGRLNLKLASGSYAEPATSGTAQSAGHVMRLNDGSNTVLDIGGNAGEGFWLQSTDKTNLATNLPLLLNPNGGNVGIGTTSPAYSLDVLAAGTDIARFQGSSGTGCTLSDGGVIACSSDERLKTDIADLGLGLDELLELRPVSYRWKAQSGDISPSLGFIAQEVEPILPSLVKDDNDSTKSLNQIGLIPVIVSAVQELAAEVAEMGSYFKDGVLSMVSAQITYIRADFIDTEKVKTKELCVEKSNGELVCVTGDDLDALLDEQGVQLVLTTSNDSSGGGGDVSPTSTTTQGVDADDGMSTSTPDTGDNLNTYVEDTGTGTESDSDEANIDPDAHSSTEGGSNSEEP